MRVKSLHFRRDEVVQFFQETFKEQADQVMAEGALMDLVRRGVISGGKAAELLGISRWDLPDLLAKHDVPSFQLLPGETMEEHLRQGGEVFRRIDQDSA